MKILILFLMGIVTVFSNQCISDYQAMGSSLSGTFQISATHKSYLMNILEDQEHEVLYFIGFYMIGSVPQATVIYKSDYSLNKLKVMTYDFMFYAYSIVIDEPGDFIYMLVQGTNKIVEIDTNLSITRELSITSADVPAHANLLLYQNLYMSMKISSEMVTCRWDRLTTNMDCLSFGVDQPINYVPIAKDVLFFGSIDSSADQYYLIGYNYSDPSNLVWKKSFTCPNTACVNKISPSILSHDKKSIYTMIVGDNNFLFYKLNSTDGSPQNPGFVWSDVGYDIHSMRQFNDFVAIQIRSNTLPSHKRLILINADNSNVHKEYKSANSHSYAVGRIVLNGTEFMYHSGIYTAGNLFYLARTSVNNIDQISEFIEDSSMFTKITTNYLVSSTTATPGLSFPSQTLVISGTSAYTASDVTVSISPSISTFVALWNEDHIQSVQRDSLVKIDFTWSCAQVSNYTAISFTLTQTNSHAIPDWVQMDGTKQELYLNKTPNPETATKYYFSLQISFNSETHYKRFEITVEECSISNCETCQLGNSSVCETCASGYQVSEDQQSCIDTQISSNIAKTATGFVVASLGIGSVSSLLSSSSLNSIFSIMNSLQLVILLPLVPDYFSPKISDLIHGMGFSMLSFDFWSIESISFIKKISSWISYPQTDEYLTSFGIGSGSSFVNFQSLIGTIILFSFIHLWIFLFYKCLGKPQKTRCQKAFKKLFVYFTFNIYIRIFIQAFMFTTLSILIEMYTFDLETTEKKISFGICIFFGLCSIALLVLSILMYVLSFSDSNSEKYIAFSEYFNGIKPKKYSKLYPTFYILLRLLLGLLLVFGKNLDTSKKVPCFYFINIIYAVYLLAVRPFENPQDNIIEVINQAIFCCLATPMIWVNTQAEWTEFYERYFTSTFMASPIIGTFICLLFMVKSIFSCTKRIKRSTVHNIAPKKTATQNKNFPQDIPKKSIPNNQNSVIKSSMQISRSNVEMINPFQNQRSIALSNFKRSKLRFPRNT